MTIREMSTAECLKILAGARLARLACAREDQPYIVPVYLAYGEVSHCLYGFTTDGQKVAWMRTNPKVCVEVDDITDADRWVSIVVVGRFEELAEVPTDNRSTPRAIDRPHNAAESASIRPAESRSLNYDDERERAWRALQTHAEWWEPGCTVWAARVQSGATEPYVPIYYKIQIDSITGHEATRNHS